MKRTVLVTAANRGIGLAIARQLAELGNSVLLGSRDLKAGEDAAKPLGRRDLDIEPVRLDLTDAATIDAAINDIEKSGRQVDTLVNNAGVLHQKPLLMIAVLYAIFAIQRILYSFLLTETAATFVGIAMLLGIFWRRANRWEAASS